MSSFIPIYNALHWRKLKNHDDEDLPQEEVIKLWNFYNMIKGSRWCTFIMRGESNENLESQFGTDANHPDLLAKYLFMTGEKGRMCWDSKKYLDPDDTSIENFEAICRALARYIKEGRRGDSGRSRKMRYFCKRNKDFCNAFKENVEGLVGKYKKLKVKNRRIVNLYYLAVAHTINSYTYMKASSFVSTTMDEKVANKFTSDVCIYGWVPNIAYSIAHNKSIDVVITQNKEVVERIGFPYCDTPVYPEQKEVALRCGFLPHFIIGFMVGGRFYVNPAISRSMDKMMGLKSIQELNEFKHQLITNGLDVDQSNFEEFCRMTNFKRYYTFDGEKYKIYCLY